MRGKSFSLVIVLIVLASNGVFAQKNSSTPKLRRSDFPEDFIFGSATSAYQVEGGAHEDGRGPSIWDTFSEKYPEKIKDGSNGSVADNSYHLYKEDVALLHQIGFNAYRFSISWSRILPRGNLKGGINQAGIDYYNNLINELLSKGIKPFATMFHWDTPQGLEDAYGGFRGAEIVNDFRDYADICFKNFGDRVKHWMTLNEPLTVVQQGYVAGAMAPGRCSKFTNPNCSGGDGATEPYIVGHNLILSHGAAVEVYRKKYKASQKGQVGIALNAGWNLPYTESAEDRLAAARAMAFTFDYFMEPLVTGKYPVDMVNNVKGGRLPTFTAQQSKMLKGSYDFIGINYYSSTYAKDVPCSTEQVTMFSDPCASVTDSKNISVISFVTQEERRILYSVPEGLRKVLNYIKDKYNNPTVYIKENGINDYDDGTKSKDEILSDIFRIKYHEDHLQQLHKAIIEDGCDVRGYYVWSLLDNFEWEHGYSTRFGLYYVDYDNNLKRYPKDSVNWFKQFLSRIVVKSIKPFVTIYHWDIPQALDDEYGGFLSPRIIVCFQEFGDKVDMWITFNEPYIYSVAGYDKGNKAMGRCSKWVNSLCVAGDSSIEPYLVSHHLLLAHAAAVEEFRNCDKISQDGKIGIVLSPFWVEPYDVDSSADKEAVERALDYYLGWHLDPLIFGDYPKTLRKNAGNRLPSFTRKQTEMIKNSFDFIGINYYSARYVTRQLHNDPSRLRFTTDQHVEYKVYSLLFQFQDELKFIYVYPEGIRKLLNHIKNKYNNPTIYITENGYDDYDVGTKPREQLLKDIKRIEYHEQHLQELHKAIT
ncbi:hypothetical protein Bca52824_029376 [Brassica carinata]|uniref:Sinigrinase n=1 Tax=Brassica carinata TaxID=52824 RepID=A0A8X7VE91_BRACI|nr:hypothetical protein Bca52824_029376 [Brassica carinata]